MTVNNIHTFSKGQLCSSLPGALEIAPIILRMFSCQSVIDIGCGAGHWVNVFRKLGVPQVQGIDHPSIKEIVLPEIADKILFHDLTTPLEVNPRFDLAICLEVAEHLPASSEEAILTTLSKASDIICFSAAIPGQAKTTYKWHVNEQWQSYWANLLKARGYSVFDPIRPEIWGNSSIPVWYKQNILLYVKDSLVSGMDFLKRYIPKQLDIVHPELFMQRRTQGF